MQRMDFYAACMCQQDPNQDIQIVKLEQISINLQSYIKSSFMITPYTLGGLGLQRATFEGTPTQCIVNRNMG
jgi:hypothetical protein